jgi:Uma2 family endonuclease
MTPMPDYDLSVTLPADHIPGPQQGNWTFDDYRALPDDGKRYEVMNGVLIMTPSPEADHQSAVLRLAHYLLETVEFTGLGRVLSAPFEVRLTHDKVVQPDVLVVLNANLYKLFHTYLADGPDLVIEVASPSTALYDRLSKYEAYEQAAVPEYWIVHPQAQSIEMLILEQDGYQSCGTFKGKETLPSRIAPGIASIAVEQFFFHESN